MKKTETILFAFLLFASITADINAEEISVCYESRVENTWVKIREIKPGLPNVVCSDKTAATLLWKDPFYDTVDMGEMPIEADYSSEDAVVRPREDQLRYFMPCTACHDGEQVPYPKDKKPRLIEMHQDIVESSLDLKHGRGAIWCLDCHSAKNRNSLIDHRGNEISFNQPQKLCGKCHGQSYRDWRDGIHGKRIGMWTPGGKKRWWVCTECHDPHNTRQAPGNRGFAQLEPEPAPELPRGMKNADHEKEPGHIDLPAETSGSNGH